MQARIVVLTPLLGMHPGAATKEDDGASAGICVWYQSAVQLFSVSRRGCWDHLLGWRWKA